MATLGQACADARSRCGTSLSLEVESRSGGIKTRRTMLFALWVARRLDVDRERREAFAWNLHLAELDDDALVAEAARAFGRAGRSIPTRHIYHQLREMELRAYLELSAPLAAARVRRRKSDAADPAR